MNKKVDKMEEINIAFDLDKVSNEFYHHYKSTNDRVKHIYYAIDNFQFKSAKLLPTENMPFEIEDFRGPLTDSEHEALTKKWLFKSACNDLIIGLSKSLIEAFRYLKYFELKNKSDQKKEHELKKAIHKIEESVKNAHIPEMLNFIQDLIGKPLYLYKEVKSINKLRNCLVHRDGVVTKKDCNNEDCDKLILKLKPVKNYIPLNQEIVQLSFKMRKKGVKTKWFEAIQSNEFREYKLGDQINIDLNVYNEITHTLLLFVQKMYPDIPRP